MPNNDGIKIRPHILVLESVWSDNLSDNTSVRPFIEGWANAVGVRVGFRTYHDSKDLQYWLNEFKKAKSNPHICYIAGHGSGKRLHGSIGANINLKNALKNTFPNKPGPKGKLGNKGILIGACEVGGAEHMNDILNTTGYPLSWIAGYKQSVPWMEAMVCELLFLTYKLTGRCKSDLVSISKTQSAKKAVKWVCDDFLMAGSLGFGGIDRK
jgi:hypothetical protein